MQRCLPFSLNHDNTVHFVLWESAEHVHAGLNSIDSFDFVSMVLEIRSACVTKGVVLAGRISDRDS